MFEESSGTLPPTMNSLPNEIVVKILEYVSKDKELSELSKVDRRFHSLVTDNLYRLRRPVMIEIYHNNLNGYPHVCVKLGERTYAIINRELRDPCTELHCDHCAERELQGFPFPDYVCVHTHNPTQTLHKLFSRNLFGGPSIKCLLLGRNSSCHFTEEIHDVITEEVINRRCIVKALKIHNIVIKIPVEQWYRFYCSLDVPRFLFSYDPEMGLSTDGPDPNHRASQFRNKEYFGPDFWNLSQISSLAYFHVQSFDKLFPIGNVKMAPVTTIKGDFSYVPLDTVVQHLEEWIDCRRRIINIHIQFSPALTVKEIFAELQVRNLSPRKNFGTIVNRRGELLYIKCQPDKQSLGISTNLCAALLPISPTPEGDF